MKEELAPATKMMTASLVPNWLGYSNKQSVLSAYPSKQSRGEKRLVRFSIASSTTSIYISKKDVYRLLPKRRVNRRIELIPVSSFRRLMTDAIDNTQFPMSATVGVGSVLSLAIVLA
jgi:hypothetical protein